MRSPTRATATDGFAVEMNVHEATAEELLGWDARTVGRRRGHVYQSRAWAAHLSAAGWRPRFLVFDDGFGVLSLERRWPLLPGGSSYVMRGPVPADDDPAVTAGRLEVVAGALAAAGVDVVASDAEVPADTGYPALLARRGFHPIEEIQPSRHRMSLPLGEGADEAAVLGGFAKSTRQRIRGAEKDGIAVVRHDLMATESVLDGFEAPREPARAALDRFYDMLRITGDRRGFTFGGRADFVPWWTAAHADGMLVYLEARVEDIPVAGLVLYRHGGRLSTVHSADRAETRRSHPGALQLLRWAAIRIAIAERSDEMDLGGVDVVGARRPPRDGEPTYGLYEHKRSFGARWVQLSGAHEHVNDQLGYRAGTVLAAVRRRLAGAAGSRTTTASRTTGRKSAR